MKLLITGIAGFVGFHLALDRLNKGNSIIGVDNFNHYYDPFLKKRRAHILRKKGVEIVEADICDLDTMGSLFKTHSFTHVVNLAAQVGVRNSVTHPHDYISSNI